MRDLAILFIHLLTTIVKLMLPGGRRAVISESLLLKHQLVVLNRGRELAPNLRPMDRVIAGPKGPSPELIAAIVEIKRRIEQNGLCRSATFLQSAEARFIFPRRSVPRNFTSQEPR